MNENRENLKKKIRALLAKTIENGATEAEAMAAAEKASELMLEHDLTFSDINSIKDETWGKRARPFGSGSVRRRHFHEVQFATNGIAYFCDCKVWFTGSELTFFGTQTDTEIAHFMVDMIREISEKSYREYTETIDCMLEKAQGTHGKTIRANFMIAFMNRIHIRLRDMKRERENQLKVHTTGTSLVVVKGQELQRRFNSLGLKIGHSSYQGSKGNDSARSAGDRAGNNANLSRGIGGGQKAIR